MAYHNWTFGAGCPTSTCPLTPHPRPHLLPTPATRAFPAAALSHTWRHCHQNTQHNKGAPASTARRVARLVVAAASAAASGAQGPGHAAPGDDAGVRVEEPSTALLLAWFACGNRSLLAAQCLVEVLVELYREGRSFEELQLSIKMAAAQSPRGLTLPGSSGDVADSESGEGPEGGAAGSQAPAAPPLLTSQDEDVLVSWVALVFLTLEDLGVPRDKQPADVGRQQQKGARPARGGGSTAGGGGGGGSESGMAASSAYLRGMLGYVRQTLGMYDEGQTLARVAGLQGLVQQSQPGGSAFLVLMQQYTRLVLLAVEVVAAAGLPTVRPLHPPETVRAPSGYSAAFTTSCSVPLDMLPGSRGDGGEGAAGQGQLGPEQCPPRGLAVRLMMAFTGAVLGSQWSLKKFVEGVRVAYAQGLAADELFAQLDEQEFAQTGGLLPVAAPRAPGEAAAAAAAAGSGPGSGAEEGTGTAAVAGGAATANEVTKVLLSSWISISYMALAQLGVPNPAAARRLGWAWAGFGDTTEALGINDFVLNTIRTTAGADPRVIPAPPPPPATATSTATTPQDATGAAGTGSDAMQEAGAGAGASTGAEAGAEGLGEGGVYQQGAFRRGRGSSPMLRVEDSSLPNTSSAYRVLTQQVSLVQAIMHDVLVDNPPE